jgi:hypothetical protein
MFKLIGIILCLLWVCSTAEARNTFESFFTDQTLRIDYFHTGDAKTEIITLDKIYRQGTWAGNPDNCIQPFELGLYKVSAYDIATNTLIYSKGYSTIFAEYQTIGPAIQGIKRTYHETVLLPCPKKKFMFVIEKRDRYNLLSPIYTQVIDPSDYHIADESVSRRGDLVIQAVNNGNPHKKVDLVILAEGYQQSELEKFKSDLKYYTGLFFSVEPYKSMAGLFNISGVFSPSEESGTDEPRQGIYKNTRFGSSFNAFDLDRYCLDDDNKSIRDVAARVPYDAILIMVNKDRYGGGGIFNWQTVFCTGSPWRDYVFLHEFGHAFAGLGDEYFSSPVSYEDFYTPGVEPLDPNITALLDPSNVKWKQFLSPGIDVPTDWNKPVYDSLVNLIATLNTERDKTIEKMKNSGASEKEISGSTAEYQVRINKTNREVDEFLANHPLKDEVGVFEGANYLSKGLYRPTLMSLMHKFEENRLSYDVVNEEAIIATILYYTGN